MQLKDIKIGTKLEIIADNDNNIISSFEQYRDEEDEILITYPMCKGFYYSVDETLPIKIKFFTTEGIFSFNAQIIDKLKYGELRYLLIKKIGLIEKVQQRNYYRLTCIEDIQYCIIDELNDECNFINSHLFDISGGGLSFKSKEKIEINTIVKVKLMLNETRILKGTIIRSDKNDNNDYYYNGLKFIDLTESERQKIIYFINNEQIKLRQKGLL